MQAVTAMLEAEGVACLENARKHVGNALLWGVEGKTGQRHIVAALFWLREASVVFDDAAKRKAVKS